MVDQVKKLLLKFDEYDLERLVTTDIQRQLEYLAGPKGKGRKEWLVQCALATHGTGIFRESAARRSLFLLLPDDQLGSIKKELCGDEAHNKPFDNAMALSNLTWSAGSAVVNLVSDTWEIPLKFLPHQRTDTPTVQNLQPYRPLPPLHPHQEEVRSQAEEMLENKSKKLLVQMPTGSGKTRTMVEALASHWRGGLDRNCLVWLAHSEELCEQAADSISRVWPERADQPVRLVRLFGRHEPRPPEIVGSIVVVSLQKAHARVKEGGIIAGALQRRAQAVVFDEAHRALAPTYKSVTKFLTANGAPLIGLTATPGRGVDRAHENQELADLFGGNLVVPAGDGDVVDRLEAEGILAKVRRREVETGAEVYPEQRQLDSVLEGFDYSSAILKTLSNNHERNQLLIETIKEECSKGRPAIVFACSVSHAQVLSAALNLHGISAACIHADMPPADRYSAIIGFRSGEFDVLTNFGVLSTGFDAPRTRTVIVARPTNSAVLYAQMVGRALRGPKMGGGEEAWVVDIRDNLDRFGAVTSVYHAFERFWQSEEAEERETLGATKGDK